MQAWSIVGELFPWTGALVELARQSSHNRPRRFWTILPQIKELLRILNEFPAAPKDPSEEVRGETDGPDARAAGRS